MVQARKSLKKSADKWQAYLDGFNAGEKPCILLLIYQI